MANKPKGMTLILKKGVQGKVKGQNEVCKYQRKLCRVAVACAIPTKNEHMHTEAGGNDEREYAQVNQAFLPASCRQADRYASAPARGLFVAVVARAAIAIAAAQFFSLEKRPDKGEKQTNDAHPLLRADSQSGLPTPKTNKHTRILENPGIFHQRESLK